jgi:hypothetical protein
MLRASLRFLFTWQLYTKYDEMTSGICTLFTFMKVQRQCRDKSWKRVEVEMVQKYTGSTVRVKCYKRADVT